MAGNPEGSRFVSCVSVAANSVRLWIRQIYYIYIRHINIYVDNGMGGEMVANAVVMLYSLSMIESMYSLRHPLVEYILSFAGTYEANEWGYTANDSRDR